MPAYRRKVHEQALRMSDYSWSVVMGLPDTCDAVGVPIPRWAVELLDHANDLSCEAPTEVLEALLQGRSTARCKSRVLREWGIATGLWELRGLLPGLSITPLGEAVCTMWIARHDPRPRPRLGLRPKIHPDDLTEPYRPRRSGEEPPVVEDGTPGTVHFKYEVEDGGPAWLGRGDRSEPLFGGTWVHVGEAEAYAREHDHSFEIQ